MAYPATYRYTKEHEWIEVEGKTGRIGITDYAQNSLGDIVYVENAKLGSEISAGKVFGSVESVKAVSDLYSPVSGKVTAVNEELATSPEKLNTEPHTSWIVQVDLTNEAELNALLDAAAYEKFIAEETGH